MLDIYAWGTWYDIDIQLAHALVAFYYTWVRFFDLSQVKLELAQENSSLFDSFSSEWLRKSDLSHDLTQLTWWVDSRRQTLNPNCSCIGALLKSAGIFVDEAGLKFACYSPLTVAFFFVVDVFVDPPIPQIVVDSDPVEVHRVGQGEPEPERVSSDGGSLK